MVDEALGRWLLDNDPALRWQVERDLLGAPEEEWQATRAHVATEGFGARLLELQDDDGLWAGGTFFPAGFDWDTIDQGQPWTATTWVLNDLREWGLDARVLQERGTVEKLARARWDYENLPYWGGEEYLLERRLFRRLSTGEPVGPWVDRFIYPMRWLYSVLNALDHFRRAGLRDPRMAEAVELVRAARRPDGTWLQGTPLKGEVWFPVDVPEGEPSPWLTLIGTRVLDWWDATA